MLDLPPLDTEHSTPPSHFEHVVAMLDDANTTSPTTVPEIENPTIPEVVSPTTPVIEPPTVPEVDAPSEPQAGTPTEESAPTEGALPTEEAEETPVVPPTEGATPTDEAEEFPHEAPTDASASDDTTTAEDDTVASDDTTSDEGDTVASDDTTSDEGDTVATDELPDEPSDDDLLARAKEIREIFTDGFQWSDLGEMVKQSYEFIAKYQTMSPDAMRTAVIGILSHIIDLTDTPYLPDRFTDPLFKAMLPPFVDLFGRTIAGKIGKLPTTESEKPTPEKLTKFAETIKETFEDGFQWEDLAVTVRSAIEFIGSYPFLPSEEKQQCVIDIVNHVIDITDTPKLPDTFVDPIFKSMVPSFVEVIFSKLP